MSLKKPTLAVFLALVVPSALLTTLQLDVTNVLPPTNRILVGYFTATGPQSVVGAEGVPIVKARCLVRWMLNVCARLGGETLTDCNAAIQFAAVWAALIMIYLAAARLMPRIQALAAVLLAAVFVPWGYLRIGYSVSWPYDLPVLFFTALGVWAIVARRFAVFAVALALGTLNKETIVCLLPAYVLAEWPRLPRKTLILHALVLGVLFLAAYELPRTIYLGNRLPVITASTMEYDVPRWRINIQHLILSQNSTPFESIYWVMSLHLLPLLRLFTLPWTVRAMYVALPALLVPIFFCGNIHELRLYNELIPLGAIATVFAFARLLEEPATPTNPAPSGGQGPAAVEGASTAVPEPTVP